jgi:hypothetical protein
VVADWQVSSLQLKDKNKQLCYRIVYLQTLLPELP